MSTLKAMCPTIYETVGGCDGRLVPFYFEGREMVAILGEWGELQKHIKRGTTLAHYVDGIVPDEAQAVLAIEKLIPKKSGGPRRPGQ